MVVCCFTSRQKGLITWRFVDGNAEAIGTLQLGQLNGMISQKRATRCLVESNLIFKSRESCKRHRAFDCNELKTERPRSIKSAPHPMELPPTLVLSASSVPAIWQVHAGLVIHTIGVQGVGEVYAIPYSLHAVLTEESKLHDIGEFQGSYALH